MLTGIKGVTDNAKCGSEKGFGKMKEALTLDKKLHKINILMQHLTKEKLVLRNQR